MNNTMLLKTFLFDLKFISIGIIFYNQCLIDQHTGNNDLFSHGDINVFQ